MWNSVFASFVWYKWVNLKANIQKRYTVTRFRTDSRCFPAVELVNQTTTWTLIFSGTTWMSIFANFLWNELVELITNVEKHYTLTRLRTDGQWFLAVHLVTQTATWPRRLAATMWISIFDNFLWKQLVKLKANIQKQYTLSPLRTDSHWFLAIELLTQTAIPTLSLAATTCMSVLASFFYTKSWYWKQMFTNSTPWRDKDWTVVGFLLLNLLPKRLHQPCAWPPPCEFLFLPVFFGNE